MKKYFRMLIVLVVVILVAGTISVDAASVNGAATSPWYPLLFKDAEDGIKNLSTAFVGKYEIPMLSYSKTGSAHIYEAFKATSAVAGDCGPNNEWVCRTWDDLDLVPGTVSNMAAERIIDTHTVSWVYSANGMIRGARVEYMNDMTFVTDDWTDLIDIGKFGGGVVGTPSLQSVGSHYRLAVTIMSGGDFPTYQLVYMYYLGNSNNSSCRTGGFAYQCDVIDTITASAGGSYLMGAPSLAIAGDGTVGIAYFKLGDGIKYAYPHTDSILAPSNCGPGGNTWRCISIFSGTDTGTVGNVAKLALGQETSQRGIAFTYDDELIPVTLYFADYVGSGGNCGEDVGRMGILVYKWQCKDIVGLGEFASWYSPSYSVDIDPAGYPVIAFDYGPDEFSPLFLYLTYPKARLGLSDPGWLLQTIDGAPTTTVATGAQATLSLNSTGHGFISYLQEEESELPDLKIALQGFNTFLPVINMH
jgi:hypothetical protein